MFSCAQREKRVKKREEKRREKTLDDKKKFLFFFFFFLFSFSGKTKTRRDLLCFFARRKKKKRVTHQRKKKEKKTIIKYIPRARVEMSKRLQVQRRKRPRGGYTKRVRRLFWWSVFISHVCATFTAQTEHVFFLFLCSKEEKKICPLALSLFLLLKTTQQKREEKRRNENEKKLIKKNIIKNVAARALRKTSVLSFRARHGRDALVMNRWRSSVFFIWTRMYLYITVYSPLLFCVFFLLRLLVFLDSCKRRFFPFRSKKEKEREELFFAFLVLSFLVLSGAFERDKKKRELFFFFYYLTRTNKRTRMRRWDWKVRQEEESKKTTLDWRRCFSFFVVSFCVLVFDQDVVSFREEREKREPPKKPKKGKKKFSRSKKFGFLFFFFFFLFQKRAAKERRGLQKNILDRVENFYHSIIIGQFKFQLAS